MIFVFISDFFHSEGQSLGPSMALQMAQFISLWGPSNTVLYMYMHHILFIHSSVSGHSGCFHVLPVKNRASQLFAASSGLFERPRRPHHSSCSKPFFDFCCIVTDCAFQFSWASSCEKTSSPVSLSIFYYCKLQRQTTLSSENIYLASHDRLKVVYK